MNERIYIAGCGGMLGKAFYEEFSKDYDLKCTDKDVNEDWLSFCDFRHFDAYQQNVFDYKPDFLFHLGAHTDLEYCENNPQDAYDTNTLSVKHAVAIANELGIPLLYISTGGIYDGNKEAYTEEDLPVPLSVYGQSKYDGEIAVREKSQEYIICRAGWMMGGGRQKDKKFVSKIVKQLESGNKELFIVKDRAGTPTYTVDFAANAKVLVENRQQGLFHMVCEGATDRLQVTHEILKTFGIEDKIKVSEVFSDHYSRQYHAPRPDSERLINQRLMDLGLNKMRNWRVCLQEYLKREFSDFSLNSRVS